MRHMVGISRDASQGVQGSFSSMTAPLVSLQTAYAAIAGVVSGVLVGQHHQAVGRGPPWPAPVSTSSPAAWPKPAPAAGPVAMAQRLQAPYAEVQQALHPHAAIRQELGGGVREATVLAGIPAVHRQNNRSQQRRGGRQHDPVCPGSSGGKLQGDEANPSSKTTRCWPELAGALGVTIGELRKMGEEGELTSDKVANALLSRAEEIEASVSNLPDTVGGAFEQNQQQRRANGRRFQPGRRRH